MGFTKERRTIMIIRNEQEFKFDAHQTQHLYDSLLKGEITNEDDDDCFYFVLQKTIKYFEEIEEYEKCTKLINLIPYDKRTKLNGIIPIAVEFKHSFGYYDDYDDDDDDDFL